MLDSNLEFVWANILNSAPIFHENKEKQLCLKPCTFGFVSVSFLQHFLVCRNWQWLGHSQALHTVPAMGHQRNIIEGMKLLVSSQRAESQRSFQRTSIRFHQLIPNTSQLCCQ